MSVENTIKLPITILSETEGEIGQGEPKVEIIGAFSEFREKMVGQETNRYALK